LAKPYGKPRGVWVAHNVENADALEKYIRSGHSGAISSPHLNVGFQKDWIVKVPFKKRILCDGLVDLDAVRLAVSDPNIQTELREAYDEVDSLIKGKFWQCAHVPPYLRGVNQH
jgi:hypothetical protein